MAPVTEAAIAKLREFSTCDVSDALCKLRYPLGGFLAGLTMWSPERQAGDTKIVGPAYTVKYVPLDDPAPKTSQHYIDQVPENSVIFVSCPNGVPNAAYGGLMSTRAIARKCKGAVVDGRFRDLEEQRALNFPVFALDVGTAPPYSLVKVSSFNEPVKFRDTTVRPGDLIIGDLNGVVLLPADAVDEVLPMMDKQVAADKNMAMAIRQGMSFVEASATFR